MLKPPWKVFLLSFCVSTSFHGDIACIWRSHTYLVLFNLISINPCSLSIIFVAPLWIHSTLMASCWYWGFRKWTHLSDLWCVISTHTAQIVFINHYIIPWNLMLISVTITPKAHSTLLFSKYITPFPDYLQTFHPKCITLHFLKLNLVYMFSMRICSFSIFVNIFLVLFNP